MSYRFVPRFVQIAFAVLLVMTATGTVIAAPPGNIVFRGKTRGDVLFSHSRHVGKGLECAACHPAVFPRSSTPPAGLMDGILKGQYCGSCHNGRRAFAATNCVACHKDHIAPPGVSERYVVPKGGGVIHRGDVTFRHSIHTDAGLRCNACHPSPFAMKKGTNPMSMAAMDRGQSCGKCHNGSRAFATAAMTNCFKCHNRLGTNNVRLEGVTFRHASHTRKSACADCHPKPFSMRKGTTPITMAAIYDGQSCGKCHNGTKAFGTASCTRCHDNLDNLGGTIRYGDKVLGDARFSHRVHVGQMRYGCESCHSQPFRMKAYQTGFRMDAMLRGQNCGSCHDGRTAFSAQSCASCHNRVGP